MTWMFVASALAAFPFVSHSDGSAGDLLVPAGTSLEVPLPPDGVIHASSVTVEAGATLTFARNTANTPVYLLSTGPIVVTGDISVDAQDLVSASGAQGGPGGFDGGSNRGTGPYIPGQGPYGGNATGGTPTATPHHPSLLTLVGGSGGGGWFGVSGHCGGGGGGGALLLASDVSITIDGVVSARPSARVTCTGAGGGDGGDGAGGAIRVAAPIVDGTGTLTAFRSGGSNINGEVRVDTARPDLAGGLREVAAVTTSLQNLGDNLFLIPPGEMPRVRVVSVGSEVIADTLEPAYVTLPNGSPQNQNVVVEVIGFGDVAVNVRLRASQATVAPQVTVVNVTTDPITHQATAVVPFVPLALTRLDVSAD